MLIPTLDRVIVRVPEPPQVVGKLFLPDSVRGAYVKGKGVIIAIGPGKPDPTGKPIPPHGLSVGDNVQYRNYAPMEIEDDREKYLIMDAADVLCVVKGKG